MGKTAKATFIAKKVTGRRPKSPGAVSPQVIYPAGYNQPSAPIVITSGGTNTETLASKPVLKALGVSIVGVTAYFVANKFYKQWQEKRTASQLQTDVNVQYASALRNAMNPGWFSWMKNIDGTNEAMIYEIASKITDYDKVAGAYYKLYQSDLTNDLQRELDSGEYNNFLQIIAKQGTTPGQTTPDPPPSTTQKPPANRWCYLAKAVTIRAQAKIPGFWESPNKIVNLDAGKIAGITTGEKFYDSDNNVYYTEIMMRDGTSIDYKYRAYLWSGACAYYTNQGLRDKFNNPSAQEVLNQRRYKLSAYEAARLLSSQK